MGTYCDFYVGLEPKCSDWLGSCACDGNPMDVLKDKSWTLSKFLKNILISETEKEYRKNVYHYLTRDNPHNSVTREDGWTWCWEDSRTTDYSYTFCDGFVYVSCFGHKWREINEVIRTKKDVSSGNKMSIFPNMDLMRINTSRIGGPVLLSYV